MYDLVIPGGVPSRYPNCSEFIDYIIPQLAILIQETSSGMMQESDMETASDFCSLPSGGDSGVLFNEGGTVPPLLNLSTNTLSDSDSLAKMLHSVHKGEGAAKFAGMSKLENIGSLEPSTSFISARDSKDTFRASAKMKLRDSCDISSDVLCEPMDLMQSTSLIVKNSVHDNHAKTALNGFLAQSGTEERKVAIRLMNTVCRWLIGQMGRSYNGISPKMYR